MKKSKMKLPKIKKPFLDLNKFGRKGNNASKNNSQGTEVSTISDNEHQPTTDTLLPTYSIPEDFEYEDMDDIDNDLDSRENSSKMSTPLNISALESRDKNDDISQTIPALGHVIKSPNNNLIQRYGSDSSKSSENSTNSHSSQKQYVNLLNKASSSETSILMELDLDGSIKYLSDIWKTIIGSNPDDLLGVPISDIVVGNSLDQTVFQRTIDLMLQDDTSYRIKFTLEQFLYNENITSEYVEHILSEQSDTLSEYMLDSQVSDYSRINNKRNKKQKKFLELEAQGILIHDVVEKVPLYTMWIVKPFYDIDEFDNLPVELVEKLGFGSTIFQKYLDEVEKMMVLNEKDLPPNEKEVCRICENEIVSWWLESHCSMCLCEHNLYNKIMIVHDNLMDCKQSLLKIKEMLLNLQSLYNSGLTNIIDKEKYYSSIEYKDITIDVINLDVSLIPTLNLFISYCDDGININNSEMTQSLENLDDKFQDLKFEFSPTSKQNIDHVQNWAERLMDLYNGLNDVKYSYLKLLLNDALNNCESKVQHLLRLQNTQKYHWKINSEITSYTHELIMQKIQSNILNIPSEYTQDQQHSIPSISIDFHTNTNDNDSFLIPSRTGSSDRLASPVPQKLQNSFFNQSYLENSNDSIPAVAINNLDESKPRVESLYSPKFTDLQSVELKSVSMTDLPEEIKEIPTQRTNSEEIEQKRNDLSQQLISSNLAKANADSFQPSEKNLNSGETSTRTASVHSSVAHLSVQNSNVEEGNSPHDHVHNILGGVSRKSSQSTRINRRSSISRYSALASLTSTPRRGSPLSTVGSLNSPLSVIKKNPTAKSLQDKSPMASPFLSPLEYVSSTTNPNPPSKSQSISNNKTIQNPLSPLILASGGAKINYRHSTAPNIIDYDIVKPISKGAFGSVFLSKRKLTGEYFAIKVLKKSDMISKNQVTNIKEERAIMMSQIDKTYTAKLYATFQNKENLFLVMEYLPGGDLAALIKMVGILPEKWTKQYISEVIYGVDDMHKNGIIHHDLKPDNLLLDSKGHVKFIDFGLSRRGLVHRQRILDPSAHSTGSHEMFSKQKIPSVTSSESGSSRHDVNDNINIEKLSSTYGERLPSNEAILAHFPQECRTQMEIPHASQTADSSNTEVLEALKLKESGSHYSFSVNGISRSSTPPLLTRRKNSGISALTDISIVSSELSEENSSKKTHDTDFVIYDPLDTAKQNKRFMGTPDYLAPETILGAGESELCDWWSVGCMLFEFMFAYPPFHAASPTEIFQNILKGKIEWPSFENEEEERLFISVDAKDLITRLLTLDPKKRLGANGVQEIKNHPYFKDVDWDHLYEEEAGFVPTISHPEDTDYFDVRGATMDIDFQLSDNESAISGAKESSKSTSCGTESQDSLHEYSGGLELTEKTRNMEPSSIASMLGSVQTNINESTSSDSFKTSCLKSSSRTSSNKLNDNQTEFGSFNFRNIVALDKANKDVINRLKSEHLGELPQSPSSTSSSSGYPHFSHNYHHQRNSSLTGILRNSFSASSDRRDSLDSSKSARRPTNLIINELADNSCSSSTSTGPSTPFFNKTGSASKRASESSNNFNPISNNNSSSSLGLEALVNNDEERLDALSKLHLIRRSRRKSTNRRLSDDQKSGAVSKIVLNLDILLCESIPIHSYFITKHLEKLGCRVVAVDTGDELVRRAMSDVKFDMIFSTYLLPTLSCVDIFKLLKNTNGTNCNTPFVVMTVYYGEAAKLQLFDEVLEKPVPMETLRKTLTKYALKKAQEDEDSIISDAESDVYYDASYY